MPSWLHASQLADATWAAQAVQARAATVSLLLDVICLIRLVSISTERLDRSSDDA
jgi:ACR3 family arsenite efflux pump ArsB